jgi:hypothetical protein
MNHLKMAGIFTIIFIIFSLNCKKQTNAVAVDNNQATINILLGPKYQQMVMGSNLEIMVGNRIVYQAKPTSPLPQLVFQMDPAEINALQSSQKTLDLKIRLVNASGEVTLWPLQIDVRRTQKSYEAKLGIRQVNQTNSPIDTPDTSDDSKKE